MTFEDALRSALDRRSATGPELLVLAARFREDTERYAWLRSLARRGMLEPFVALNQLDRLRSDERFDAKVDVARRMDEAVGRK